MPHTWILDESKYLKKKEVSKLRNTCFRLKKQGFLNKDLILVRDWFMVELGLFTGLRVQEMTSLNYNDIFIEGGQSSLIVRHGKGNRKRLVIVNQEFKKAIAWFLGYKSRLIKNKTEDAPIFCSLSGNRLSKRALQKAFKRCIKKAGLPKHYSIHCLRHTYGTYLYKVSNHNLRLVQQQLGHSSVKTTEIYANLFSEDAKEAVDKLYQNRYF